MEPNLVRIGIAGLGRSGWDIHARLLDSARESFRVTAVFDQDASRLKEAETRFSCRTYGSFEEFLQDRDTELVTIALPNHLHVSRSIQALRAGKHVVCEKPMAATVADADRLIQAAKQSGKILTVFQNQRYAPDFLQVKRVIDSGVLGRITAVRIAYHHFGRRWDWQTLKKFDGGSLNNTGPHPLDQALVLFGDAEPDLFCIREKTLTLGDAEDHLKVILHKPGSPTIEIEIMSDVAYPQSAWLVLGTRGGLSGSRKELAWKYFRPEDLPDRTVDENPAPDRKYNSEPIPFIEQSWSKSADSSPGEQGFYPDLYRTIREGQPLAITPESVRRQVWVMEQCRQRAPG